MDPREHFLLRSPRLADYWRGIILFGRNVATYKFALARYLLELRPAGGSVVRLEDLAEPFSRHICEHLKLADRQATSSSSRFLQACRAFNAKKITKEELVSQTARLGFNNVIDAFHVVNQQPTEERFFLDERKTTGGIRITDRFSELVAGDDSLSLDQETNARWRLVETAWDLGVARHAVIVDVDLRLGELFVPQGRLRRVNVTGCREALNGYQKGQCFYCFRAIGVGTGEVDVDHFLPHVLKDGVMGHLVDGVWNLVLACPDCNRGPDGKFARVPSKRLLERLWVRNEYLIASHHPLRETLMRQTGRVSEQRRAFLTASYQAALDRLLHSWEPAQEGPDPFFSH